MDRSLVLVRVTASVSLLAVAVWLGGLFALGAIAAPVVFTVVPLPASADAMTIVFRRFDQVSMGCGAVLLASEALRTLARFPLGRLDGVRIGAIVTASALAVYEGLRISPHIAELHAGGAIRGLGESGLELSRWHDVAEACGKGEVLLLVTAVVAFVLSLTGSPRARAPGR